MDASLYVVKWVCGIVCSLLALLLLLCAEDPWMSSPGVNCSAVSSHFRKAGSLPQAAGAQELQYVIQQPMIPQGPQRMKHWEDNNMRNMAMDSGS